MRPKPRYSRSSEFVCSLAFSFVTPVPYEIAGEIGIGRDITKQASTRPRHIGGLVQLNRLIIEFDVQHDQTATVHGQTTPNVGGQNETPALVYVNRITPCGHG
jgi:hypothetical protein